jgi:hypothetical protein
VAGKTRAKPETVWVTVEVETQDVSISYIKQRSGVELSTYITFTGTTAAAIRDVSKALIQIGESPVSSDSKIHLGALIQVKPELTFVLDFPPQEMSRLLGLVAGGRIVQVAMACQPTTRGRAMINSWRVSTQIEE